MSNLSNLRFTHEAVIRLMFHASHVICHGFSKVICATDFDMAVLGIAVSGNFANCKLSMAFGYGSRLWYIPYHPIAAALGSKASRGLLFMHAIKGCDHSLEFARKQHGLFDIVCQTLQRSLHIWLMV